MKLLSQGTVAFALAFSILPARAGIFANIEVGVARHNLNGNLVDGVGIPFAGKVTSNFVLSKTKCTEWQSPEYVDSMCRFEADFSNLESPYIDEFNSRLQSASPISDKLSVSLYNRPDGSYFGQFTFLQGKGEFYTNATGRYQVNLHSNYQFWFEGTSAPGNSASDLNFAHRIWSEGVFTRKKFSNSWSVIQLLDSGDSVVIESESWEGSFAATVGIIPEPTTSLLFVTGLVALFRKRRGKNSRPSHQLGNRIPHLDGN